MDIPQLIADLELPVLARCRVPGDIEAVTDIGEEAPPQRADVSGSDVDRIWERAEALYRSGLHPAIQLCVRRCGHVVLNRAIGHARGNAPQDPHDAKRVPIRVGTPVNLFSAAKAITAMVIHKLDEKRLLHIEDRVSDYIPEFAQHGKERITLRHLLSHRAGIPNLPEDAMDLAMLERPEEIVRRLCESKPQTPPGRLLAYHAVTSGFLLGEVVRRVSGKTIRDVLEEEVRAPLGLHWLHYGVDPGDVERVALNAVSGPAAPPPISWMLERALGTSLERAVEMSNDPRFLTGIIPSANVLSTAEDVSAFYQCLLQEGALNGVRVFEPATVRHAISEQGVWEVDLTLGMPISYSLGFMLGNAHLSLFGWNHPQTFGHIGLSNVFCWADPERQLAVGLLTTGKPVLSLHVLRLAQLFSSINETFPPVECPRYAG